MKYYNVIEIKRQIHNLPNKNHIGNFSHGLDQQNMFLINGLRFINIEHQYLLVFNVNTTKLPNNVDVFNERINLIL